MPTGPGPAPPTLDWGQASSPAATVPMPAESGGPLPAIERGSLIIIRQFDIADEVDLIKVQALHVAERSLRTRPRSTALLLSNPPLAIALGSQTITLGGSPVTVDIVARVFDFGTVSVRMRLALPSGLPWADLAALVRAAQTDDDLTRVARKATTELEELIASTLTGRHTSDLYEDYAVVFVERFAPPIAPHALPLDAIARLLLGEEERFGLSAAEIAEATRHRSSYYGDDLCVSGWNVALVVEPRGDADPVDVLELANAQLLELRFYDQILDRELGRLYDEVALRRRRWAAILRNYGPLLRQTMALLLEIAEFVERVENALKIIGDVYLARLYTSAVDVLRIPAWERSVTRKQALVEQVYDVLKSEVDTWRDQLIEVIILLLIVGELFLALHVTK
jgi:hypothetical protein